MRLVAAPLAVALIAAVAVAGCAASRPSHPTTVVRYTCADTTLTRESDRMSLTPVSSAAPSTAASQRTKYGWTDDAGDHFMFWPQQPSGDRAVEVIAPADPREDATRKIYDASRGSSQADWELISQQSCRAEGGYTDALVRYMRGDSFDRVAADLGLENRAEARVLVRAAIRSLTRRYYREH